jgi:hypothetical protein
MEYWNNGIMQAQLPPQHSIIPIFQSFMIPTFQSSVLDFELRISDFYLQPVLDQSPIYKCVGFMYGQIKICAHKEEWLYV